MENNTGREQPLVSVITPTFNRAGFIGEAVQSVLDQTVTQLELIVVDDGSTDDTRAVLASLMADPRLRYFYQPNQGQSVARNLALSHARGDFICFLDSDNVWPRDKLATQLEVFREHPQVDVVYGDIITIDEQGHEISRKNMRRHSGHIVFPMLKDNCVSMNTTMARKSCFDEMGGMSGQRRVADDYDLWLKFSARYRFYYRPEYLAYYRVMKDQISSDKTRRFETNEAIIRDFRRDYPQALPAAQFNEAFAFFYTRKARYLAETRQYGRAFASLTKAIQYRPFYRAPWRALGAILLKRGKLSA
ncbi:MAG: glycosyltransferase [Oleiphilaceae bacterium]|nr:glycosyltransferase [Oleiphilaceae bacterium]